MEIAETYEANEKQCQENNKGENVAIFHIKI
jgi:hypothetical protein